MTDGDDNAINQPPAVLVWTGKGFVHGVPARSLTADEVEFYGGFDMLINTGLYVRIGTQQPTTSTKAVRAVREDK